MVRWWGKEGTLREVWGGGVGRGVFTVRDGNEYRQIPRYLEGVVGERDVKVLSNVARWAVNNREATVSVVENIPILKSAVEGSGSDRDYNQNIERLDVGIKLKLTPQVNPDREIQLHPNQLIPSVVDESGHTLNYTPTLPKR